MKSLLSFTIILCSCIINTNGSLDNTFGNNGIVITDLFPNDYIHTIINDIVIQPDDKIVAVGEITIDGIDRFWVARYLPDGSLDNNFGASNQGTFAFFIGPNGDYQAKAVALQSDGKIVVAGVIPSISLPGTNNFSLIRINSDGVLLDYTFGNGNGYASTNFGQSFNATDVAIQDDGKIVIAGYATSESTGLDFAIVRYNGDGTLDNTFSDDGRQTTDFSTFDDVANAMVLQPDGKIILGGTFNSGARYNHAMVRYNSDGSIDADSFGWGGYVIDPLGDVESQINSLLLQPDGKIIAAGVLRWAATYFRSAVTRYHSNGSNDDTFGDNHVAEFTFVAGEGSIVSDIVMQSDNKIVAACIAFNGADRDFAVARLLTGLETSSQEVTYEENISTYPNPTSGIIYITPEFKRSLQLVLYTTEGQLVSSWKDYQDFEKPISVESLPSGVYFLKIYDKEGMVALKKVIKE